MRLQHMDVANIEQLVSLPSRQSQTRQVTAVAVVGVNVRHVEEGLPKTPKSMMQWVTGCPSVAGAEVGLGMVLSVCGGAGGCWEGHK